MTNDEMQLWGFPWKVEHQRLVKILNSSAIHGSFPVYEHELHVSTPARVSLRLSYDTHLILQTVSLNVKTYIMDILEIRIDRSKSKFLDIDCNDCNSRDNYRFSPYYSNEEINLEIIQFYISRDYPQLLEELPKNVFPIYQNIINIWNPKPSETLVSSIDD
jgi:hypothetical protein